MFAALYRLLLRGCPAEVRADCAPEMEEEIALWLAGAGPKHKRWRQGRALVDLLVFMVTARRDERRRQRGRRPRVWKLKQNTKAAWRHLIPPARIQRSHRAHAGARHRRLDGHFQRGVWRPAEATAVRRADRIVEIFQAIPARQINQSSLSEANTWDIKT